MNAIPYELLIGTAFGLLVGFVPALLVGLLTLVVKIVRDATVPPLIGIGFALPFAGATAISIGIFDPTEIVSQGPRLAVAAVVSCLLVMIAISQGGRVAAELPRDTALSLVRGQPLSMDALNAIDASGQVTIRSAGHIREVEGYPPLSPELQVALEEDAWRFPADLQLAELERRLERHLRTEYELSVVTVSIDARGRATITAAPSMKRIATAVPDGMRAVTISGLIPVGLEPGDDVSIGLNSESTSVDSENAGVDSENAGVDSERIDGIALALEMATTPAKNPVVTPAGTATTQPTSVGTTRAVGAAASARGAGVGSCGGDGRLTVAVSTTDAGALLNADRGRIAVTPRGTNHEYEAIALLEEAGWAVAAVEYDDLPTEADDSLEEAELLAVCSRTTDAAERATVWSFEPADSRLETLASGDRAFLAGERRALEQRCGESSSQAVPVSDR